MIEKNTGHYIKPRLLSVFLLLGLCPFTFYAAYHLRYGMFDIGIISLVNVIFTAFLLFQNHFRRRITWQLDAFVVSISFFIIYACYFLGIKGLFFVFPFIIGIFFNYSVKFALITSSILAVLVILASLHSMDSAVVARVAFPLIMTIIISYLYANTITRHREALTLEANVDYLTGIYNRRNINSWLQQQLKNVDEHALLALYFIDIDDFKRVNDNYGHAIGDKLLVSISKKLLSVTHAITDDFFILQGKVGRLAGDEFVVIISGIALESEVRLFADKLLSEFKEPIVIDDVQLDTQVSIGVASTQDYLMTPDTLLNYADIAMFEAKKQGKNRIGYFNQFIADKISHKNDVSQAIKDSLAQNLFYLNFMPIYDSTATQIVGAEALIRSHHPLLSSIGPEAYIRIAEEYGLVAEIDLFVIESCFQYMEKLIPELTLRPFLLAINISSLELKNEQLPSKIEALANQYHIPPSMIEFEITETSLVDHGYKSIKLLQRIKEMGYKLSLDDFGTGYTAFNQLQHFPVDTLKIDRSFIWAIDPNYNNEGLMIDVILSLAKLYKLNVIAEGVEEPYQLEYLKKLKCSQYQGYLLSKPLGWEAFKEELHLNQQEFRMAVAR
ncbi:putative bifunctional diguanylate cyclase/phosphodiesterase [Pseudocolwellia agarivorans]|uniref:putative bifunctional diguanylate cyclase/phosphodiesterase n=1 Tax=Pseudocolwellia agarivorans TaxID=1911682 RepID=UPI0009878E1B|nr:GGDEF domain-containing phosphodiesterase [Pseudocolwellia agarivorans]